MHKIHKQDTTQLTLEIVQLSAHLTLHFKPNALPSRASKSSNSVRISRHDSSDAIVLSDSRHVSVAGSTLDSRGGEHAKVDLAAAGHGEGGGLELGLGWEEEDEGACFAGAVCGFSRLVQSITLLWRWRMRMTEGCEVDVLGHWNIEVKDGADGGSDLAKVARRRRVVRLRAVNRDDEVRELPAWGVEVGGAGRWWWGCALSVTGVGVQCDLLAAALAGWRS